MISSLTCPFCAEMGDPGSYVDLNQHWPFEDRLMFKNAGAMVVPGHGPQVYPYALVIPFRHTFSFMDLSAKERVSVFDAMDYLAGLSIYGGRLCVFEHGGSSVGRSCQCIAHCHLHVISASWVLPMWQKFQSFYLTRNKPKKRILDCATHRATPLSYLFLGSYQASGRQFDGLLARSRFRQVQFFRRRLAECLVASGSSGVWDWRECGNQEMMVELYRQR